MDFTLLIGDGNIGFYNCCEITELFIQKKSDNSIINFYTIAVCEEKEFNGVNHQFLCKPIQINSDYSLGIQRYWLSKQEALDNYQVLKSQNKWQFNGSTKSQFPQLKMLPKQFVTSVDGNHLNKILKNNFHNGSYIIEFFDEKKDNFDFILDVAAIDKLNILSEKIKNIVPIDLSVARDRIGNFIFQFPVTILQTSSRALKSWIGIELEFAWHNLLTSPPNCLLQVESILDKNFMGSAIVDYNKATSQKIEIGNLEQTTSVKVWRKDPSLLISSFMGSYIKEFHFNMGLINHETRLFEIDGSLNEVQITSNHNPQKNRKPEYNEYITNTLYEAEKKQLESSLSFKQYRGINSGLDDLRKLIIENDDNGVCLWDPFLNPTDILKTLYFSKSGGVPLKAIGSINDAVKNIFNQKGKSVSEIMSDYKIEFENPNNNNHNLNLEFRLQHTNYGWSFHDRFLIFPSSEQKRAKVYSLGTSINSYGKNHHILQEVSHPQPVVDAFNELWASLEKPECIVWKFPKT